ncbi:MAG: helix-turn-helix domain-containing protein [Patescibacteria group bacterium]
MIDLDRKSAGKILGVSVRTIDRYIRSGKLFAYERSGRIWLKKDEIARFSREKMPVVLRPVDKERRSPSVSTFAAKSQETDFYKDLYEEAKRVLTDYQQKLEQSNYRIGQLESQTTHPISIPKTTERYEDSAAQEIIKRELHDRERELAQSKELFKQERAGKIAFSILTYILLAAIPLIWYLLR